jgi:histidinol-phosphate/aromatic aminotransferase/cobyric acid decarboxylase-like protein
MRRVIARARGVNVEHILPGAGSSDLIFSAFTAWATPASRVLILDPMYGEYAHVLERVIGACVEQLSLSKAASYDVGEGELRRALARGYDWIVLVNPNSPTGRLIPSSMLAAVLRDASPSTRVWIDETYVDFAGDESLEQFAAASSNVIVCKSMSKAYALSGARAGYLCGPAPLVQELRRRCPPWAVSLPAQIAACEALRASSYYEARWRETAALREELATSLREMGLDVVPGCANFLLCRLPANGPETRTVVAAAREHGLFLRDVSSMGSTMGPHDVRIAVKDQVTNQRMKVILRNVLEYAGQHHSARSSRAAV